MLENAREIVPVLGNAHEVIDSFWLAVGAVWLFAQFRLKPVARVSDSSGRAAQMLSLAIAAVLLFTEIPPIAELDARYLPASAAGVGLGVALTAAGAMFAILGRLYLGPNWSASATLKQDHELIRSGPYCLVRHPIYSGMLLAVIGTAIAFAEVRDLLAVPLAALGFWLKATSEERLLMSSFGDRYAAYRREVRGAIIPRVL